jgi:hypothetical protein
MHKEQLRMLLNDVEEACVEVAEELDRDDLDDLDDEEDEADEDAAGRNARPTRLERLSRDLFDIAVRLRDARLQVDQDIEGWA